MSNSCCSSPRTSRSHQSMASPLTYGYPPSVSSPMRTSAPPISRMESRRWPGGSQRDERMRTRRWRDGRLSIAPPKGVNGRNFPVRIAFGRARGSCGHGTSGHGPFPALRPAPGRDPRIERRYGGQELLGVRVPGVVVHLVGGTGLDDPAAPHHGDPVADLAYDGEVVRDEDQRESELPLQLAEQGDHLGLGGDVESGDRFVADDDARVGRERPRDAHALALAAAELVRVAVV